MNKELELLDLIASDRSLSQREIGRRMDVSLGTVNNMIQTLEDKKYLSVKKESTRKVYYDLTKEGQTYHNLLYVEHISSCFDTIACVRKTFKENLNFLVEMGKAEFYIDGIEDELIRLAKMCFFEISRTKEVQYRVIEDKEVFFEYTKNLNDEEQRKIAIVGWSTTNGKNSSKLMYKNLLS